MRVSLFLVLIFSVQTWLVAQEIKPQNEYVKPVYTAIKLINLQTTKLISKKSFTLNIQHRFGKTHLNDDFLKDFMGLDLTTNMRFAFSIPITDKLFIGVGRTKSNKNYDASFNYTFLQQTKDNAIPFSLSLFASVSYMSNDFSSIDNTWTFTDGTSFEYKQSHRLAYYLQTTFARRFSNWLSLQFSPIVVKRNLVEEAYNNAYFIVAASGKIKTGFKSGIIFEQSYIFNKPSAQTHPYSIGYELGTASHTFQITMSSSKHLLGQDIYHNENQDILDGYFYLGFNLFRTFYIKK